MRHLGDTARAEGATGAQWVEARNAATLPTDTKHKTAPTTEGALV